MKIFVEGKEAFLKKGTSFEFIAENRLFSGSDEYTLSITFPIVDCPLISDCDTSTIARTPIL